MFSYNLFRESGEKLLAVCDEEMLDKTFSGGNIEIAVSDFYRGGRCGEKEIIDIAKKATIINATGNRIVNLLVKNKIVEISSVLDVGGVMHAQVVTIK